MKEAEIEVPKYLCVNPMSNSGLSEQSKVKVRNAIYDAYKKGEIDETTKNKLMSKVNFTGKENDYNEEIISKILQCFFDAEKQFTNEFKITIQ